MTAEGFERALRTFARRRPFRTFCMELHSGAVIRVAHPEAASVRGNVVVFIETDASHRLFDSTSVCQLFESQPADMK
jgi:hypothetical protein